MDVFTVIYTTTQPDETESIPWQLSFTTLLAAKLHVIEEANVCAMHVQDVVSSSIQPLTRWTEHEDYAQFTQQYSGEYSDTWMIVKTELVQDSDVERRLDSAGLACYNQSFRIEDGETNVTNTPLTSSKSREDGRST